MHLFSTFSDVCWLEASFSIHMCMYMSMHMSIHMSARPYTHLQVNSNENGSMAISKPRSDFSKRDGESKGYSMRSDAVSRFDGPGAIHQGASNAIFGRARCLNSFGAYCAVPCRAMPCCARGFGTDWIYIYISALVADKPTIQ